VRKVKKNPWAQAAARARAAKLSPERRLEIAMTAAAAAGRVHAAKAAARRAEREAQAEAEPVSA
jgi:cob(I)alamin adenosyltransferase